MSPVPAAFDVAVVGGGIHGLSAAWNLVGRARGRVVLLEQFRIGHDRGSSHGRSRITRTSYHDAAFARLALEAQREDWPRLERDAGLRLTHPTPGVFFGPADGRIRDYAASAAASGAPVDDVPAPDARRRFPQFAFGDGTTVLVDRSAAVISAAETIAALARLAAAGGVEILEETPVERIEPADDGVRLVTREGTLVARRAIVTAGAWVRRLLPSLAQRVSVARQTVCYFEPPSAPAFADGGSRLPRFPVWVWLGREEHDHFYGLPEFGRPGLKAARHRTCAGSDDPDVPAGAPSDAEIDEVRSFLARELTTPPGPLVAWERCLYTNEPREEFVLGPLDGAPSVIVGAACSGHAFKFGPLVGRRLAEMATDARGY